MLMAEFSDFSTLGFILGFSHWARAPTEEQLRGDYFRKRMWEAVRRLPHTEELLAAVLIEIIEEVEA